MTTDARAAVAVVPMLAEHADQVLAIYQLGIDDDEATFEPPHELRRLRQLSLDRSSVLG